MMYTVELNVYRAIYILLQGTLKSTIQKHQTALCSLMYADCL